MATAIDEQLKNYITAHDIWPNLFDTVRLVEQEGNLVCLYQDGKCVPTQETCYSIWGKNCRCSNCISHLAYTENTQHVKFEYAKEHYYFVIARPVEMEDGRYVIEFVLDATTQFARHGLSGNNFVMDLITELERVSSKDVFSGLYNKTRFNQLLMERLARAKEKDMPLYLALWDVDRFKQVNDLHGHDAGDNVILAISHQLRHFVTDEWGVAARFGGDEFGIVFFEQDRTKCRVLLEGIAQAIAQIDFPSPQGGMFHVTASYGLADVRAAATPLEAVHLADISLYRCKEQHHAEHPE